MAISLDERLAREIRRAAGGQAISAWLADAAERKLRARSLAHTVAEWEEQHGAFAREELEQVARAWASRKRR